MHCPDCGHILTPIPLGLHGEASQSYRCYRCGGFWIEPWLANRVQAKFLDKWPQTGIARAWSGHGSDECPLHVGTKLDRYTGESVPRDLVVKRCRQCRWWWFPANTIFAFKPAQEAKVNYYRLWGLPPDLSGMLLPVAGLIILIAGAAVAVKLVRQQQYVLINANGPVRNFAATYLGNGRAAVTFVSQGKITQISYRRQGQTDWMLIPVAGSINVYRFELQNLAPNSIYEVEILGNIFLLKT